jgi:VTC domain-containing protein
VSEVIANPCASGAGFLPAPLESPSLFRQEVTETPPPAAYEIKFLLAEEQARALEGRVRCSLALDPHGRAELGGAYQTTSLYTETPEFDVFRRVGDYGNTKFRVRRYASTGPTFLERKDKRGDKVHKVRAPVGSGELSRLAGNRALDSWAGQWFCAAIAERRLAPICRIAYERTAYLGSIEGGTLRVTFDRRVRGEPARTWEVAPVASKAELLPGRVICEFKYRLALPRLFKEVMETLGLHPTPCSKYRHFIAAAGLAPRDAGAVNGAADDV